MPRIYRSGLLVSRVIGGANNYARTVLTWAVRIHPSEQKLGVKLTAFSLTVGTRWER